MRKTIVLSALFGAVLFASPAYAFKVYQLQGNQWAIICDDGTGYSFSGSQTGANDVGGILCPEGIVPGGGTVVVAQNANTLVKHDRSGRYVPVDPRPKDDSKGATP